MTEYKIVKDPTGNHLRWRVMDDTGHMISRYSTRTTAALMVRVLEGDLAAAPQYYRRLIRYAAARMSHKDAIRYAVGSVQMLGLGPQDVRADPKTGEPDALGDAS